MPIFSSRRALMQGARALVVAGLLSSGCSNLWEPYLAERLCPVLEDGEYRLRISPTICWEEPAPHGNYINSVFTRSKSDAWAVSSSGAIQRWDGADWRPIPSGRFEWISGVWAIADDDAWAVGAEGGFLHWDGKRWRLHAQAQGTNFRDLKGTTRDNAFAVGDHGAVWRWDGLSWSDIGPVGGDERLYGVWSVDASNAWATSEEGNLWYWNGSGWLRESGTTNSESLLDVWGIDAEHLWTAGGQGTIQQRTASGWNKAGSLSGTLYGIWGANQNDLWISGVGIYRFDGATSPSTAVSGNYPLTAYSGGVHGSAADDIWFGGSGGRLVHWNGTELRDHARGSIDTLWGIWVVDSESAFAVGDAGTVRQWNGRSWSEQHVSDVPLYAVWGSDRQNVWAVGAAGAIFKWDGRSWGAQQSGVTTDLRAISRISGGRIGAVGAAGAIIETRDGTTWTKRAIVDTRNLRALWSDSKDDAWVVGDGGLILRWGETDPIPMPSNVTTSLTAVWGSGPSDVWIPTESGSTGAVLHWDGSTLQTVVLSGNLPRLLAVWGTGPENVWVAGQYGTLLHWDGATWAQESLKNSIRLNGVAGFGPQDFWMVGVSGAIIRYRG